MIWFVYLLAGIGVYQISRLLYLGIRLLWIDYKIRRLKRQMDNPIWLEKPPTT